MAFGLDKFTRLFSRPSKNTSDLVFIPRCEIEAIEKVDRPENTSTPKETVTRQKNSQSIQEQVVFLGGPQEVIKALTSGPPESLSPQSSPSLNKTDNTESIFLPNSFWLSLPSGPKSASIGTDVEKGDAVTIGDKERCGGVYVLGQPRAGKSTLLTSMALSDIEKGYSILFIDPHTDAINDLLARIPENRRENVILLDPTRKDRSFGINLLHCADRSDPLALGDTWGRVHDIFVKVWGEDGRLGVWLEKILRNSVYLLLENPEYTLIEIPLLLEEDTTFRNELLKNVKINPFIKDFWFNEFDRLTRRDKTEQVGPSLSRLDLFRTDPIVRQIVGQKESTIDFREILTGNTQRIVLLRMPTQLRGDVKTLIGTMLLSEVVHAAFDRAGRPEKDRPFFAVYCDEFQEFATPDFAKLFTQTGKYKLMPAVAHQTRAQFKPGDPNQGATLASPTKVFFALSSLDAREVALEIAKEPPTETRLEEQYVVSEEPVRDLLQGHTNTQIRAFVNKYLRHLDERREDTRQDMELARLRRMHMLDRAGLYGLDERIESLETRDYHAQVGHLRKRGGELLGIEEEGLRLLDLFDVSEGLRLTNRKLNRFLTAIMEGEVRRGTESFSDFLVSLVRGFAGVEKDYAEALELYISLSYGNAETARIIPFEIAERAGLFVQDVGSIGPRLEAKLRWENLIKDMELCDGYYLESLSLPVAYQGKTGANGEYRSTSTNGMIGEEYRQREKEANRLIAGKKDQAIIVDIPYHSIQWSAYAFSIDYALMRLFPQVEAILRPYFSSRFSREKEEGDSKVNIPDIKGVVNKLQTWDYRWLKTSSLPKELFLHQILSFLRTWREGAFCALSVLALTRCSYRSVKPGQRWGVAFDPHITGMESILGVVGDIVDSVGALTPVLTARVPTATEIQTLIRVCREKLGKANQSTRDVVATIDEFVAFCDLLSKPENHVKTRSRQYVEKQIRTRQEADMVNEIARVLTELPRHQAFVKLVEESGGEQQARKCKIRTAKLPDAPAGAADEVRGMIEENASCYTRPRGEIEEEIRKRQEKWRRVTESRPPVQTQREARPADKPVEPPPTRTSTRLPGDR